MIYTLSRCADPLRSAFESHKQSAQRDMRRQAARARREAKRDAALDKWAAKMDKRVKEPFRNTYRYYCPPAALFIVLFFALRDYYHGWAAFGFSFLNISIFWRLPETGAALAGSANQVRDGKVAAAVLRTHGPDGEDRGLFCD